MFNLFVPIRWHLLYFLCFLSVYNSISCTNKRIREPQNFELIALYNTWTARGLPARIFLHTNGCQDFTVTCCLSPTSSGAVPAPGISALPATFAALQTKKVSELRLQAFKIWHAHFYKESLEVVVILVYNAPMYSWEICQPGKIAVYGTYCNPTLWYSFRIWLRLSE